MNGGADKRKGSAESAERRRRFQDTYWSCCAVSSLCNATGPVGFSHFARHFALRAFERLFRFYHSQLSSTFLAFTSTFHCTTEPRPAQSSLHNVHRTKPIQGRLVLRRSNWSSGRRGVPFDHLGRCSCTFALLHPLCAL